MKNTLVIVLLNFLSMSLFSQSWVRPEDAAKHKGDIVNLVGFISSIKSVTYGKHPSIVMFINKKDSSGYLSLVLSKVAGGVYIEDLKSTYLNQYVQVRGKIEIDEGNPQIVIHRKKQMAIAKEDRRIQFFEPE